MYRAVRQRLLILCRSTDNSTEDTGVVIHQGLNFVSPERFLQYAPRLAGQVLRKGCSESGGSDGDEP